MKYDDSFVAILFHFNGQDRVTLMNSRSRNRFRKLITEWAPAQTKVITQPEPNQNFAYIELEEVLAHIEQSHKEIANTPAISSLASRAFSIISTIRAQNDYSNYNSQDSNDD